MKLFKLLPALITLSFISCSPQPSLAADFIYGCKPEVTTECKVTLEVKLNNESIKAKASNVDFYWCNGWNTTSACPTSGTIKVLNGEFTSAELSSAGFSIKTDVTQGWVCYPSK